MISPDYQEGLGYFNILRDEGRGDSAFWADKCLSLFCLLSLVVSLWMETQGSAVLVFVWCGALGGVWISARSPLWDFSESVR